MRLQSVIIPDEKQYSELYYRGGLTLAPGETLAFNTYFNSFCYTKYREHSTVQNVCFSCEFSGRARIELCVFDGNKERVVQSGEYSEKADISVSLSELPENGFLYPKMTALTRCKFRSGEYHSDCQPRDISCCIVICTYKRESYVLKNIAALRQFRFSFIDRVFVIDNGKTLDCAALSDDIIKVLPNKNYGGCGGFTRGLIEAHDGKYSHVILMDDDVAFHPETLEQMTVFVSLLKESCSDSWFSTGMLPLDRPCCQFELGAEWDGKRSIVHKHNADILDCSVLLDNLNNPGVEYGGWWTLLMPVSVMENGLPYPFFIKFDDVEYGLRKPANTQIITMNGIAVRHEAFDRKKSFVLEYYNLRNELVVNTVHQKYGALGAVKRFVYEIVKHLCLYRYENIPLVLRAVNDFLSGTDFFLNCDEERCHQELMSAAPKLIPLSNIPEWNETLRRDDHQLDKRITTVMILTFGGHIIPSFLLKKEISAVPLSRTGAVDCFMRKTVIQYQLGGNTGLVVNRSFPKFVKYSLISLGTALRLLFNFSKVKKELRDRSSEISSFEFWKKHLN